MTKGNIHILVRTAGDQHGDNAFLVSFNDTPLHEVYKILGRVQELQFDRDTDDENPYRTPQGFATCMYPLIDHLVCDYGNAPAHMVLYPNMPIMGGQIDPFKWERTPQSQGLPPIPEPEITLIVALHSELFMGFDILVLPRMTVNMRRRVKPSTRHAV